jgi:predicted transcriptional regulator
MSNIVGRMAQKKTESITFRTTEDVKRLLDILSEEHERPISDVIHQLLRSFINNLPKQLPVKKK